MGTVTANGARRKSHDENGLENPLYRLTDEQIEAIGKEFDELHEQVKCDLGERDSRYIRGVIDMQRRLALLGRALLLGARYRPFWIAGTATLSMAKIIENMEIGHNVLHGQWDWMNDPVINSSTWDWDTASTAQSWKHSHNYIHHTYTNIRGLDKDLGYEIMRIDPHQPWHPVYLLQPIYNVLLMVLFEWGVAVHDMDIEAILKREKPLKDTWNDLKGIAGKAWAQIRKDYLAWPALTAAVAAATPYTLEVIGARDRLRPRPSEGHTNTRLKRWRRERRVRSSSEAMARALGRGRETYTRTLWADVTANVIRNVWAYA